MDRARLAVVAAVLAVAGVAGALLAGSGGDSAGPTPTPTPAHSPTDCAERPKAVEAPAWLPKDLPLAGGWYTSRVFAATGPSNSAILEVPQSLDDFVAFVLARWPEAGWQLGRGEREPGEAESTFRKGRLAGGFRVRDVYCERDWVQLFLGITTLSEDP